ncbi:hypothetical protein M569_15128, partial [Genlisea aurea]
RKLNALTHILLHPTTRPSLHSQFFIAAQFPGDFLYWDYPPTSPSPAAALRWSVWRFLRGGRVRRSWRSKCPYQVPPPTWICDGGAEEGRWGAEERAEYVRMRLRRKRMGIDVHPSIPILVPNLLLLSLLFWNPFP